MVAALLLTGAPASAADILFAGGSWAALRHPGQCEAAARALRNAASGKPQARVGFAFDARRKGEFSVRLSRPARPGSTVMATIGNQPFLLAGRGDWAWSRGPTQDAAIIAAVRSARSMRVVARDGAGRRISDRYLLAGAPTAIDAAAAACAPPLTGKMR
ncbi:MAG: hypothetical protein M3Q52_08035 [Pseudomonadota bacterium]|nr:hypothetical protein [Pseudomonadota bacterium]